MELKEILAISGQPGLFKYLAQSKNGVIVEALADGRRLNAPSTAKVSSLAEISIYTESEDLPLADVFNKIRAARNGQPALDPKSSPDQLKQFMAEIVPEYDRERVHVSDIKKIVAWYNLLTAAGMTEFKSAQQEQDEAEADRKKKDETTE